MKTRKLMAVLVMVALIVTALPAVVLGADAVVAEGTVTIDAGTTAEFMLGNIDFTSTAASEIKSTDDGAKVELKAPDGFKFVTTGSTVTGTGTLADKVSLAVEAAKITLTVKTADAGAGDKITIAGVKLVADTASDNYKTPGNYNIETASKSAELTLVGDGTVVGTVTVVAGNASVAASILDIDETSRRADGKQKTTITVAIRNRNGLLTDSLGGHTLYVWAERSDKVISDADVFSSGGTPVLSHPDKAIVEFSALSDVTSFETKISSVIAGNVKIKAAIGTVAGGSDVVEDIVKEAGTHIASADLKFTALSTGGIAVTSADDSPLTADGVKKSKITAKVTDSAGNPISGQKVEFTVNKTGARLSAESKTTNVLGEAKVELTSTKAGTYRVTATSGSWSDYKDITFTASGDTFEIEKLSGSTAPVAVDYATGNYSVTVKDAWGNRIKTPSNVTWELKTRPSGSGLAKDDTETSLDTNSNSRAKFTPDVAGTYVLQARLLNGRYVDFTIEAKEMGKITGFTISYDEAYLPHGGKTGTPGLKYVDADGVTRSLTDAEKNNVAYSSSNSLLATVDNNTGTTHGVVTAAPVGAVVRKGVVTITAVDKRTDFVASADILVGTEPVAVELTPAAAVFEVGSAGTVTLQLKDEDDNNISFGKDAKMRNVDVRIISKPAGAIVETSQPGATDVDNALERTGKLDFTVTSNEVGEVLLQVLVGDGATPERFITKAVTVQFGEVPEEREGKVLLTIGGDFAFVDGEYTALDAPAFIADGRTFVPVRFIAEAFGVEVDYEPKDAAVERVILTSDDVEIVIGIGDEFLTVTVDDEAEVQEFDGAARIVDGRTFLPFRAIAEAFGAEVDYGPKEGAVKWVSFE